MFFFFFKTAATPELPPLSLHDALPILPATTAVVPLTLIALPTTLGSPPKARLDRKSTRLNSSHRTISYAVFCLKKKNKRIVRLTLVAHTPLVYRLNAVALLYTVPSNCC